LGLTGRAGVGKGQDHLAYIALAHSGGTEVTEQRWPFAMRFIENRMTKAALSQVPETSPTKQCGSKTESLITIRNDALLH